MYSACIIIISTDFIGLLQHDIIFFILAKFKQNTLKLKSCQIYVNLGKEPGFYMSICGSDGSHSY